MACLRAAEGAGLRTYRGLGHEHWVQVWLRLDMLAVGVIQDCTEALPVLNWGQDTSGEMRVGRQGSRNRKEGGKPSPGEGK